MAIVFRLDRRPNRPSSAVTQCRPRVEILEDRRLPTTFAVNSLLDGAPAADGQLTLREAITAAVTNAVSGDAPAGQATLDTITFASNLAFGTIKLQAAQGELLLNGGGDVRIVGPVAGNSGGIVVSGQGAVRVLEVTAAAGAVSIENCTLTQGFTHDGFGAGFLNAGSKTTLSFVAVANSVAQLAGGGGISNSGGLSLNHCVVAGNNAQFGGGIEKERSGTLDLNYSRIVGNSASEGGGIVTFGPNPTTIRCSTVAGNVGGGGGGGIEISSGTVTVLRSTISGNLGGAGAGGGILNSQDATLNVINCTIAGNTAGGAGGGMRIVSGAVTVVNCTIAVNTDTSNVIDGAGGISKAGGTLVLANSIVSLNSAGPASNVNVDAADIDTNNDNFIGGNPLLSPLQDNGGPTFTMVPFIGSLVIDTGSSTFATLTGQAGGTPILRDQRGARRDIDGDGNGRRTVDQGAVEISPSPIHPIVVGSGPGGSPRVQVYDGLSGQLTMDFLAFAPAFTGGVRVAAGDVTGDGVDDIVAAAGPGGGPQVNLYDGVTGSLRAAFAAFNPVFTGGVQIAVGDVNRDGFADVITGVDAGGAPVVVVYDGLQLALGNPTPRAAFLAFNSDFVGGVRVAAGDVNGDGFADVIAAKGPGAAPRVRVFSGNGLTSASQTLLLNFLAYATTFTGGVYVAAGDTDGDGMADVITGPGAGGAPTVNVFSGLDASSLASFAAFGPGFTGGVRVGAADLNGDGLADIIAGKGPGNEPTVKVFDGRSRLTLTRFDALDAVFAGGVFVGGA